MWSAVALSWVAIAAVLVTLPMLERMHNCKTMLVVQSHHEHTQQQGISVWNQSLQWHMLELLILGVLECGLHQLHIHMHVLREHYRKAGMQRKAHKRMSFNKFGSELLIKPAIRTLCFRAPHSCSP